IGSWREELFAGEALTLLAASGGWLAFALFERLLCRAALLSCRHEIAGFLYKRNKAVCQFSHPIGLTSLNCFRRNQVLAYPDRPGSRQDKTASGLLVYPSGSDKWYPR